MLLVGYIFSDCINILSCRLVYHQIERFVCWAFSRLPSEDLISRKGASPQWVVAHYLTRCCPFQKLSDLWTHLLGVPKVGSYQSEKENVDEDILLAGKGVHAIEIDLMQPLDSSKSPKVSTLVCE